VDGGEKATNQGVDTVTHTKEGDQSWGKKVLTKGKSGRKQGCHKLGGKERATHSKKKKEAPGESDFGGKESVHARTDKKGRI